MAEAVRVIEGRGGILELFAACLLGFLACVLDGSQLLRGLGLHPGEGLLEHLHIGLLLLGLILDGTLQFVALLGCPGFGLGILGVDAVQVLEDYPALWHFAFDEKVELSGQRLAERGFTPAGQERAGVWCELLVQPLGQGVLFGTGLELGGDGLDVGEVVGLEERAARAALALDGLADVVAEE